MVPVTPVLPHGYDAVAVAVVRGSCSTKRAVSDDEIISDILDPGICKRQSVNHPIVLSERERRRSVEDRRLARLPANHNRIQLSAVSSRRSVETVVESRRELDRVSRLRDCNRCGKRRLIGNMPHCCGRWRTVPVHRVAGARTGSHRKICHLGRERFVREGRHHPVTPSCIAGRFHSDAPLEGAQSAPETLHGGRWTLTACWKAVTGGHRRTRGRAGHIT